MSRAGSGPWPAGKAGRLRGSLRRELTDDAVPFAGLPAAQAATGARVHDCNTVRPH
jgi:hypothetical protein